MTDSRPDDNEPLLTRAERKIKSWHVILGAATALVLSGAGIAGWKDKVALASDVQAAQEKHADEHRALDAREREQDKVIAEMLGYMRAAAENAQWLREHHEREDKDIRRRGR